MFIPHYRIVILLTVGIRACFILCLGVFVASLFISVFWPKVLKKQRHTFWSVKWVFGPTPFVLYCYAYNELIISIFILGL